MEILYRHHHAYLITSSQTLNMHHFLQKSCVYSSLQHLTQTATLGHDSEKTTAVQGQPRIVWSLLDRVRQHVSHHQPASPELPASSQQHPQAANSPQSVYLKHLSPRSRRASPIPGQFPLPDRPGSPAPGANAPACTSPKPHLQDHVSSPLLWPQSRPDSHAPRCGFSLRLFKMLTKCVRRRMVMHAFAFDVTRPCLVHAA